jgi:hypothetical protein
LGVNNADSVAAKLEGQDFSCPAFEAKPTFDLGEGSKATPPVLTNAGVKMKRNFSEEEMLMMTNMADAVNNVVNAMLKTGAAHVDPDLYLVFMEMLEFSTEALIVAYTHLLENKAVATRFVNMSTPTGLFGSGPIYQITATCSSVLGSLYCLLRGLTIEAYIASTSLTHSLLFWVLLARLCIVDG